MNYGFSSKESSSQKLCLSTIIMFDHFPNWLGMQVEDSRVKKRSCTDPLFVIENDNRMRKQYGTGENGLSLTNLLLACSHILFCYCCCAIAFMNPRSRGLRYDIIEMWSAVPRPLFKRQSNETPPFFKCEAINQINSRSNQYEYLEMLSRDLPCVEVPDVLPRSSAGVPPTLLFLPSPHLSCPP